MTGGFAAGEQQWRARLGTLRQVVRQELVSRQLLDQLPPLPQRILDVGCGQGTQLLQLARRGHRMTGVDSSADLLADANQTLDAEPTEVRERVRTVLGRAEHLGEVFSPSSFDAVLCHGVLMYFADPRPLLHSLCQLVAPGGLVSVLVRNGDALALRPALAGDWPVARKAFEGPGYLNRIGVQARSDRLHDLTAAFRGEGLSVRAWYGVRVFTDLAADDTPLPEPEQLQLILECEELAGRTDPYRGVAALTHVIAQRSPH